jgi:hypothetical protein
MSTDNLSRIERAAEVAQRWRNLCPDTLLRTIELAEALTAIGYRTAPTTLETWRSRGFGPPFQVYGRTPLYRWGDALAWARCHPSQSSNSEGDVARLSKFGLPSPRAASKEPQRRYRKSRVLQTAPSSSVPRCIDMQPTDLPLVPVEKSVDEIPPTAGTHPPTLTCVACGGTTGFVNTIAIGGRCVKIHPGCARRYDARLHDSKLLKPSPVSSSKAERS